MLSSRMPDLAALDVLLAVARTGSLTGAAREVGLTQQAVSARIASLEALTGVPLVLRTTHGSQLTSSGVVAAQWADRLLQVASEVDEGLASLRGDRRARITVSASFTVAEQLLPGWLVSLRAAAERAGGTVPNIVLTAANSDRVADDVRAGRAELGFVEGPDAPRGLRHRVVAHDELVLVVRPDHRWARRAKPLLPADLARVPLVSREVGSGQRDALTSALRAALADPDADVVAALELSTAASVRAAVLAGAGPAVLSRLAVADDVVAGRLAEVAVAGLDLRRALRAVWVGPRNPPAGAVRDLVAHAAALGRRRSDP